MTGLRRALALIFAATAFSGCIGFLEPDYLVPSKRVEKVRELADLYSQYLRFGRIAEAASFVRSEDRKAFLDVFMNVSSRVEFTGAEVMTVDSLTATTVEVWTRYELFELPSIAVRSFSEKQVWHFDAMARTWRVQPDLAVFPGKRTPPAAAPAAAAEPRAEAALSDR